MRGGAGEAEARSHSRHDLATTFLLTVMAVVRASSSTTIALDVLYVARSGVFAIELNVATRSSVRGRTGVARAVGRGVLNEARYEEYGITGHNGSLALGAERDRAVFEVLLEFALSFEPRERYDSRAPAR